jgi:hypothetical protein
MTTSSLSLSDAGARSATRGIAARIARAAATVWVLDGLYVVVVFVALLHATTTQRMFQGIAHAVLGASAFTGGWTTATAGVLLHFLVALGWSCVWAVCYESIAVIRQSAATRGRAIALGVAYGVFVWLAMRFLVLPLTQNPPTGSMFTRNNFLVLLAHVLVVGPPIVLLERRST